MKKLRVLHITPWFSTPENPTNGIFIKRQITSLIPFCINEVLHLDMDQTNKTNLRKKISHLNFDNLVHTRVILPNWTNKWKEKEIRSTKSTLKFLKSNHTRFDIINFHVPYPAAINIDELKTKFPKLKFVFNEHWSAYREQFNLQKENKGRNRIESIFNVGVPLITISNSLGTDIQNFIGKEIPFYVLPNIVEESVFKAKKEHPTGELKICSINNWSSIKNPIFLLDVFYEILKIIPKAELTIGGDGYMMASMKSHIDKLGITDQINLLGQLNKNEVAETIRNNHIYIQPSKYETFSVITAEAIMCGTPVIAKSVGGMKDFINKENGVKLEEQNPLLWSKKIVQLFSSLQNFQPNVMAEKLKVKFSSEEVGKKYAEILHSL